MIRYKCTVAYDGALYCGWQTQKKGNSIQEQIEQALAHILNEPVSVLAAGRTDAGVNAWGQVFQFDTERDMPERRMMGALNGFLPNDIHIRKVEKKNCLFHARYCVRSKRYDYRINFGPYDVFSRNFAYQCPYQADIKAMEEGSKYLIGTHDFTSFNSNTLRETPDQVRTIESITFLKEGDLLTISYRGRGFLRYMVRMMTAQLLEVGRGRLQPEDIGRILDAKSKTAARRNAHPEGLTLMEIDYYETAALTPSLAVREYLWDDVQPDDLDRTANEEAVRKGILPYRMILADRRTNEPFGEYVLTAEGGILKHRGVPDEELADIAEQLRAYQKEGGFSQDVAVMAENG